MHTIEQEERSGTIGIEEQSRHVCSSDVTEKAKQAAALVGCKASQAADAVAAGMESLGKAVRDHEPARGLLHSAGEAIAGKLEGSGRYLEQQGLEGIGEDVTNLIRRNPIPSLLIGVGVGVLVARMIRR